MIYIKSFKNYDEFKQLFGEIGRASCRERV